MLSLPLLPEITAAVEEGVRSAQGHEAVTDTVLDGLLDRLEADHIVSLLGAANVQQAADLLDPLAGTGLTLTLDAGSHLARSLATATLPDLADLIEAATAVSPATGLALLEAAGGEAASSSCSQSPTGRFCSSTSSRVRPPFTRRRPKDMRSGGPEAMR